MSVTETSKQSYKKLGDLSESRRVVHTALGELGIASNRDIAKHLNKPVNEITGRIKDLREYRFVVEHGKKWDNETHRWVTTWCVSDPYAQKKIDLAKDPAEEIKPDNWQPKAVSWLND